MKKYITLVFIGTLSIANAGFINLPDGKRIFCNEKNILKDSNGLIIGCEYEEPKGCIPTIPCEEPDNPLEPIN